MEKEYKLETVCLAIKKSWSKETCYPKEQENWNSKNPSLGQCAVTAFVLYDYFKGNIKKCTVDGVNHYFNIINKEIFDLTKQQFKNKKIPYEESTYKKKSDLLEIKNTKERYLLLKEKVENYLQKEII